MIVMTDLLKIIRQRQSTRVPFDPNHPVAKENLRHIIEAARWAPTVHNMQNFEVLVVDDKELLERIGKIKYRVSEAFIRENYQQSRSRKRSCFKRRLGFWAPCFRPIGGTLLSWTRPFVRAGLRP
jgi:nitroreductase